MGELMKTPVSLRLLCLPSGEVPRRLSLPSLCVDTKVAHFPAPIGLFLGVVLEVSFKEFFYY